MVVQFSSTVLNDFTAPEITNFSSFEIQPLSQLAAESNNWMLCFALNDVLSVKLKATPGRAFRHFSRRVAAALRSYEEMRIALIEYFRDLVPDSPKLGLYFQALDAAEQCVWHCQVAFECLGKSRVVPGIAYTDCPREIREIANLVKHFGERLDKEVEEMRILPVWFETGAIRSEKWSCDVSSLAELLKELAAVVEVVITPPLPPRT